jgi:hypothetical protein
MRWQICVCLLLLYVAEVRACVALAATLASAVHAGPAAVVGAAGASPVAPALRLLGTICEKRSDAAAAAWEEGGAPVVAQHLLQGAPLFGDKLASKTLWGLHVCTWSPKGHARPLQCCHSAWQYVLLLLLLYALPG